MFPSKWFVDLSRRLSPLMVVLWIAYFELIFLDLTLSSYVRPNLLTDVFTNLSVSFAQSNRNQLSSTVSQGSLPRLELGSAGSKVGNAVGAASSFGLSRTRATEIFLGVSAAQSKAAEAISRIAGGRFVGSGHHRDKRGEAASSSATSLNGVSGPGAVGNVGSTGVQAGPVATAVSLGSLLARLHRSRTAINAGATAAHAGSSDSSMTFSDSNLDRGDDGYHRRRRQESNPGPSTPYSFRHQQKNTGFSI